MEIKIFDTTEDIGIYGAQLFRLALGQGANVFGFATGSSPEPLYRELVNSDLDFTDSVSFNLDEYYKMPAENPSSYHYFMQTHLFNDKPFKHSYLLDGMTEDPEAECANYEAEIQAHPIDLQVLGIGRDGHIAFNEPGSSFSCRTRLVNLSESTIEANQRFFDKKEDVPNQALSMGIATIMSAKHILMIARGEIKANAVHGMIEGPVTVDCPASVLQTHPHVTILLDKGAAAYISH